MSKKHVNPYREGSNYHMAFGLIQKKQVVTRSEIVAFLMGKGVVSKGKGRTGEEAAIATATVLLSPRAKDGRGDCRGNLSAMGHIYFMQPLNKVKGTERKFRLRWREKELSRRDYERPSVKEPAKEVKQEKTHVKALAKTSAKVEPVTA
jgi:hypothetical protein